MTPHDFIISVHVPLEMRNKNKKCTKISLPKKITTSKRMLVQSEIIITIKNLEFSSYN